MKTNIFFIAITLLVISISSSAQSTSQKTNVDWYISKDTQKISSKNITKFKPLTIASVAYPEQVISKGVARISSPASNKHVGNVKSTGYPVWTISKGIQRRTR